MTKSDKAAYEARYKYLSGKYEKLIEVQERVDFLSAELMATEKGVELNKARAELYFLIESVLMPRLWEVAASE